MRLVNARNEAQRRGQRLGKRQPSSRRRRGPYMGRGGRAIRRRGGGKGSCVELGCNGRNDGGGGMLGTTESEAGVGELLRCL
jgi:hypothetical protein